MNSPSAKPASPLAVAGHGAHRALHVILLTVSIVVLAGVVPAALVAVVPAGGRGDAWVLTLLVIVWGGVRLSFLWVGGHARLFDFFFVLFCYIFMGVAPTVQIRTGLVSTTTADIDVSLDVSTALVVWLGIIVYEVARIVSAHSRKQSSAQTRVVHRARGLLLLAVGFVGSALFISRIGITFTFASRTDAFQARELAWPDPAVRSVMYAIAIYPMLIGIGAVAQLRKYPENRRSRWLFTTLTAVATLVLILIVNPIASARYTFGTVAFALAAFAGALATERRRRWLMFGTILGLLFLFPLADAFRNDVVNFSRTGFFDEYSGNPDYDAFWQISNALDYWLGGNVVIGRQILGSLLFWVPRALWPDKPMDTGSLLAQYRGYNFENLSAPLWSESLVNGGLVGVIVAFWMVGWFLRRLDGHLAAAFLQRGTAAIAGAVFPVYMTILMRGSLLQATGSMAVAVGCVLFIRGPRAGPEARSGRIGGEQLAADLGHPEPGADRFASPAPH